MIFVRGLKNGDPMTKKVDFYFDFGSPNCYLAYKAAPAYFGDAEMEIIPCLLGGIFKATGNASPMQAFAGVKGKLAYEMLEMQRFIARHELTSFKMNPNFPINTLLLMRALVAVEDKRAFIETVLAAMWEQEKNMNDPAVVSAVLDQAGIDGAALLKKTQDPAVKKQLIDNTEAAVERGVFGLPAFFVGDEMFFGKDRLGQAAEAVAQ